MERRGGISVLHERSGGDRRGAFGPLSETHRDPNGASRPRCGIRGKRPGLTPRRDPEAAQREMASPPSDGSQGWDKWGPVATPAPIIFWGGAGPSRRANVGLAPFSDRHAVEAVSFEPDVRGMGSGALNTSEGLAGPACLPAMRSGRFYGTVDPKADRTASRYLRPTGNRWPSSSSSTGVEKRPRSTPRTLSFRTMHDR